ncbi:MAG: hypothetical protein GY761_07000 [Hyphomicrobiales bacterium]|nr:hypothetical protein [Hyphomicrobiales bacterium]
MAVSVFIEHGFSKQDIHSKIVSIFSVDLSQLEEVLYSSDNVDMDYRIDSENLGVNLNTSANSKTEQFKLMVATKYWIELSESNIQ